MRLLLVGTFLLSGMASAHPLGTFPEVITGKIRANVDLRSDIWTNPTKEKHTPLRRTEVQFQIPMVENEGFVASAHLSGEDLSLSRTDLIVGDDQIQIGTDLRYQGAGVAVAKRGSERSWSQGFVTYESASDRPFKAERDKNLYAVLLHGFKCREDLQWVVGLDHSNNRGYWDGKILPIAGAIWTLSEKDELILGFPFFQWRHLGEKDWETRLRVTGASASASYDRRAAEKTWVYSRVDISAWSYMHSERIDSDNRLFFEETSVQAGIRNILTPTVKIENALGYSFERKLYEAKKVFDRKGQQHRVGADFFVAMKLEFEL